MIKLLDVENGVVKSTVHCKTIKWLKIIQDKFPKNALKIYAYLFYMAHNGEDNPYFNVKVELREDFIVADLDIDFSLDTFEIIDALERITVLYETPTTRAYNAMKIMLDNITDYIGTAKITVGKEGNLPTLIRLAKEFDGIRQSFKGVAKDLAEEQRITPRGGGDLAYDQ